MQIFQRLTLTLAIGGAFILSTQVVQAQQWLPVRGGINFGISGMALVQQEGNSLSFLVVHDNKGGKEQGRLAIVTIEGDNSPQYFPLNWPDTAELPRDLEALTAVPGQREPVFMVSTSLGRVYSLRLNIANKTISVLNAFDLPGIPKGNNIESFALQEINGKLLAVWAHRGEGLEPAILYWGLLDLQTYNVTQQGSTRLNVPWPVGSVRHISDIKVDSAGVVYISAATDNGDDGPYQSAVYMAGVFSLQGNRLRFQEGSALVPLYRLNHHKVEAIELVPGAAGGVVVGTDDENRGSSILNAAQ